MCDRDTKSVHHNSCLLQYSSREMIWFFDKDGERLRYEISHDRTRGKYKVIVTRPDGSESVEEVDQPTDLIERSVELMNNLRIEGWKVS